MLGINYTERLEALIDRLDWSIELPPNWSGFFDETGESSSLVDDQRQNRRMKIRTLAVMHLEHRLPAIPRPELPLAAYTRDFSRRGCGFIAPVQLFPQEMVRLILPTFWLRLLIVRARRVGNHCFEIGTELIEQNKPSNAAFDGINTSFITGSRDWMQPIASQSIPVATIA